METVEKSHVLNGAKPPKGGLWALRSDRRIYCPLFVPTFFFAHRSASPLMEPKYECCVWGAGIGETHVNALSQRERVVEGREASNTDSWPVYFAKPMCSAPGAVRPSKHYCWGPQSRVPPQHTRNRIQPRCGTPLRVAMADFSA